MKEITIEIQGTTALLCNRFTDEAQAAASSGTRAATNGDKGSPIKQAEKRLYLNEKGDPVIPQPNLFRCLIDAGKFFKTGKSKVTTVKSSIIPACVDVAETEIPIIHKEGWRVDTRPVRIPATGGRILCHRPMFDDWRLRFTATLDTSVMTVDFFREIVDVAGSRIGLGDFRPDCKGPFGKFKVITWKEKSA